MASSQAAGRRESDLLADRPQALRKKKTRGQVVGELTVLVLLPWLLFSIIVALFAFFYIDHATIVWVVVALCAAMALYLVASGTVSRGTFPLASGFLSLGSVSVAITVGLFVHCEIMLEYSRIMSGTTYMDVDPSSPASAHSDASVITFVPGTFVDTAKTVGYRADGSIFCVAPVAKTAEDETTVQYWAVGQDCCEQRTGFNCEDTAIPGVRSAIALCGDCDQEFYREAVQEAASQYGISSSKDALLLKWTEEPAAVGDEVQRTGVAVVVLASAVELLASSLAGMLLTKAIVREKAP